MGRQLGMTALLGEENCRRPGSGRRRRAGEERERPDRQADREAGQQPCPGGGRASGGLSWEACLAPDRHEQPIGGGRRRRNVRTEPRTNMT